MGRGAERVGERGLRDEEPTAALLRTRPARLDAVRRAGERAGRRYVAVQGEESSVGTFERPRVERVWEESAVCPLDREEQLREVIRL